MDFLSPPVRMHGGLLCVAFSMKCDVLGKTTKSNLKGEMENSVN